MAEHKHTPGPWIYYDNALGYLYVRRSDIGLLIAQVIYPIGDPTDAETRANDRLTAAASDLLMCLEELVGELRNYDPDAATNPAVVRARAAIAAATGENDR